MSLEIYVEPGCATCDQAWSLAGEVARRYPGFEVDVVDVSKAETELPEAVFAVPTYVLNGNVIFLGNPSAEELQAKLESAVAGLRNAL